MSDKELLPCPFCGGATACSVLADTQIAECDSDNHCPGCACNASHNGAWVVMCDATRGGCGGAGGYDPSRRKAIAKWNTRAREQRRESK